MADERSSDTKRRKTKDRSVDAIKELPHSVEAEQAVIGGLLLDNQAWDRVADKVTEADFYRNDHRLLFRAIHDLARSNQPFDLVTLKDHLTAQNELEQAGGEFYLFELAKNTPSAANIVAYAHIVRERSILRRLISISGEIADSAYYPEGKKAIEILDQSERKVFSIGEQLSRGDGPVSIGTLLAKAIDRVEYLHHTPDALTGIPTGFTDLDEITAGLQPADLIIIAGRPSMGKTGLAMNIGEHIAQKSKKPVLVFSLEMPGDALAMRLLSSLSRVDQKKVKTGKLDDSDWHRLASALTMMSNTQMYIDDTPALSPNELRARARRLAKQFNGQLGVIIIDYLQLMQIAGLRENRVAEISEISRSLKALAKELNVPIIALSQLNRSLEQRTDKRPVMSDLRECVTGDTLVCLSTGERVPIQTLVGQKPEVFAMNTEGKMVAAQCEAVWPVGKKPIYEVHFASGRSIKATEEHRLYGAKGWITVGALVKGDRLAIARQLPEPISSVCWSDERVILLGHLIGDGSYLKHQPLRYTSQTKENLDAVIHSSEKEFGATTKIYARDGWQQVVISGNGNRWHPKGVNGWLRSLQIYDQRSHQKRIPQEVFKLSNTQIALLLRHLWATDGAIFTRKIESKGSHLISYSTNSEGLAKDVSALLLRIGIVARIRQVQQGKFLPGYHVTITGLNNLKCFLDEVGGFGPRFAQAEKLKKALENIQANTNIDTLPKEIFGRVKMLMQAQHISQRKMCAMRGTSYGGAAHFDFAPSRAVIENYASLLKDDMLKTECAKDLFWDQVVSVTPLGEEEVYDLTVPELHNWLADGIITHNSGAIEQDADLILFIYRDEVYNEDSRDKGTAEIIIAKHRNGPTGKIRLTFLGQLTRFENMAPCSGGAASY